MMFFSKFTSKKALRKQAESLYAGVVERARDEALYERFRVTDSIDGRFDALVLHIFLVVRALLSEGDRANGLVSLLLETFVTDMDRSMRELGVGDLSVGKKVKSMMGAYRGRAQAYDEAFEDAKAFETVLIRNLYRGAVSYTHLTLPTT